MLTFVRLALAAFLVLWLQPAAAQSDIDRLIEQTGVEPAATATRDHPRWREPRKIIVRDYAGLYEAASASVSGIELVKARTVAEAVAAAEGADAIVGWCSSAVLDAASDAVWVQVLGAGVERCVSDERIRSGNVLLTNMQKMSSPVIAEHVVAMILAL